VEVFLKKKDPIRMEVKPVLALPDGLEFVACEKIGSGERAFMVD